MPFLATPLALFAIVAIPTVVAIYTLRSKTKKRVVSSLLFWDRQTLVRTKGRRWDYLRLPPMFWLELLIITLLILGVLGILLPSENAKRPLIIVLDNSFSMGAKKGEAVGLGLEIIDEYRDNVRYSEPRFMIAQAQSRLLSREQAEDLKMAWHCQGAGGYLMETIDVARKLVGSEGVVAVISDGPPRKATVTQPSLDDGAAPVMSSTALVAPGVRWHGVGEPIDNVGIVGAARSRGQQGGDRILIEVANYGRDKGLGLKDEKRIKLWFTAAQGKHRVSVLSLRPGERRALTIDFTNQEGVFEAGLAELEEDDLILDNHVRLLPLAQTPLLVSMDLAEGSMRNLIEDSLLAGGAKIAKDALELSHLRLTDDQSLKAGEWGLVLNHQRRGKSRTLAGPFMMDTSMALCEGLDANGLLWGVNPEDLDGEPLISTNKQVLFSRLNPRQLALNFVAPLSTLQRSPFFPALMVNILQWRRTGLPGWSRENARLGEGVALRGMLMAQQILGPDDKAQNFVGGRFRADKPGLYRVSLAGNDKPYALMVNPISAKESDLRNQRPGLWEHPMKEDLASMRGWLDLSPLFFLLALIGLLIRARLLSVGRGLQGSEVTGGFT